MATCILSFYFFSAAVLRGGKGGGWGGGVWRGAGVPGRCADGCWKRVGMRRGVTVRVRELMGVGSVLGMRWRVSSR